LIHGLFDSPYVLQSIAQHYINQNFLVRAILLPGHGTNPQDLNDITYNAWVQAARYGIESFANAVDRLYLCGFSTGGLLSLLEGYNAEHISGLILLAPAIKLRMELALCSSISNFITQRTRQDKWYVKTGNSADYAKYQSFSLQPAHQVHLLTKQLASIIKTQEITKPLFVVCSADDEVLSSAATLKLFMRHHHHDSRMLIYTTRFLGILDPRVKQINSHFPEKRIISFPHTCLPVASDHPHYGEHGDFHGQPYHLMINGKNYTSEKTIPGEIYYGAISRENMKRYNLRRLTYNPDFANMIKHVDDFLGRIIS
jgi:esterase/lipase